MFSNNPHPKAIEYLTANPEKINWCSLCSNPSAMDLIHKNKDKICWSCLSVNPNAIELLKEKQIGINWTLLSSNTSIFDYDYQQMAKERTFILEEDLLMKTLHPKRIEAWLAAGLSIDDL